MNKLVKYLDNAFHNTSEKCILLIEPHIPEVIKGETFDKTPDALVIKDNVFCVLELKGFHGNIIADCNPNAVWKNENDEIIQPKNSKNPFEQASTYFEVLQNFLNENILSNDTSQANNRRQKKWPVTDIHSWIVTEEASRPEIFGIDLRKNRFFKVLPLEEVPRSLMLLRSKYKKTAPNIQKIISSFKAIRVQKNEWYRPDSNDPSIESTGLIPKIIQLMNSEDGDNQLRALKQIQELELFQHRPHVIRCFERSPYRQIRQEALITLIKWQDISLGTILTKALTDRSQEIADFSLEYLSKNGFPEAFDTLEDMLNTNQEPKIIKILKAITSTGHFDSCKIIYDFARKTLFNKPFEPYQNIRQKYVQSIKGGNKEKRNEYFELIGEERQLRNLTTLVIDCLGKVQCRESVSWLIEIITKPTSIGYKSDDYTELDIDTDYHEVFTSACTALYNIGTVDVDISSFLLEKLPTSPEYFQYYIIRLLGSLEVKRAVLLLRPFLEYQETRPNEVTIKALENIGSEEAFDVLREAYISNPDSYSGVITGEALRSINEEKFVDLILEQLESYKVKNDFKRDYLQALLGSVSERCADTLFKLLKIRKISGMAAWNLSLLVNNAQIFDRAMKLTGSKNPIEQSGAMWALDKYFINNPDELERFESENTNKSVRRAVAYFYSQSDSKQKLFSYAKDPDEEVRETVFRYFTDKEFLGRYIVASDTIRRKESMVAIDDEYLAIELNKEVLIIPKKNIRETAVSIFEEYYHGLYLMIEKLDTSIEHMLLIPTREHPMFASSRVTKLISKINGDKQTNTVKESQLLKTFWEKIKGLLPKKRQQYWSG